MDTPGEDVAELRRQLETMRLEAAREKARASSYAAQFPVTWSCVTLLGSTAGVSDAYIETATIEERLSSLPQSRAEGLRNRPKV